MNSFIHKISASIFLIASFIPVAMVLSFHINQQLVRYEMKEKLEEQNLHTITLSTENVHWVKKNKEILVNGKMFDVKSFSIENGLFKFTGLYDEEETALADQLENNFNKNNHTQSWLISNLFSWLHSVYPGDKIEILVPENRTRIVAHFINNSLSSPFKIILTPPPQYS
jgi:hypothetical protein